METTKTFIGSVVDDELEDFIELRMLDNPDKPSWFVCRCLPRMMFEAFQPVELNDFFSITIVTNSDTTVTVIKREPKELWEAAFNKRPTAFDDPAWVAKHDSFFKNDE